MIVRRETYETCYRDFQLVIEVFNLAKVRYAVPSRNEYLILRFTKGFWVEPESPINRLERLPVKHLSKQRIGLSR